MSKLAKGIWATKTVVSSQTMRNFGLPWRERGRNIVTPFPHSFHSRHWQILHVWHSIQNNIQKWTVYFEKFCEHLWAELSCFVDARTFHINFGSVLCIWEWFWKSWIYLFLIREKDENWKKGRKEQNSKIINPQIVILTHISDLHGKAFQGPWERQK